MRLGILDVGSNTVHLLVVDAHPGAAPVPAYSHKTELRLIELLDDEGAITAAGVARLAACVAEARHIARAQKVDELVPFATSAIREATNGPEVLDEVTSTADVKLQVLSGPDEARLTFLAVRRWYGWSAGRILNVDIGGGSLELAAGRDEEPDQALSLPLGAGRLTPELGGHPPKPAAVAALRARIRADLEGPAAAFTDRANRWVGTSKTLRSLARIAGAAPAAVGPYVPRSLARADLVEWVPRLAAMSVDERAALPGVSPGRARQLLAGALVAEATLEVLDIERLEMCPWALREGVILHRLDQLD